MPRHMDQASPNRASSIDAPSPVADDKKWFEVDGNKLKLIRDGSLRLKALIDIIEQAEQSLQLCFYMFEDDAIGTLIRDMLITLCNRDVSVELIIDSFGSSGAPRDFFDPFVAAGGQFAIFSPRFSTSYFVRNHQKIVIADNCRALIGGFNVTDDYFDQRSDPEDNTVEQINWEDLGILIHGREVYKLAEYYEQLSGWVHQNNGNIRLLQKMVRRWNAGEGNFRWLLGGPSNRLSRWASAIKKDLETGKQLDLVSAYFSPGQGLLRRIARLSKSGGRSRLILPGKTDNGATIGASRLLYGYLLKRGTNIYEYQPRRLHAKMVVIDDIVYIGSANFDLRSLFINVEMMVRIQDQAFADHARLLVDDMCQEALPISKRLHKTRRGWINRMRWTISYFVVNILDYTVTRRFNFGVKK